MVSSSLGSLHHINFIFGCKRVNVPTKLPKKFNQSPFIDMGKLNSVILGMKEAITNTFQFIPTQFIQELYTYIMQVTDEWEPNFCGDVKICRTVSRV